jgi:hypothetical protein
VRAVDDRLFGDRDDGHRYNAEATIVHDGLQLTTTITESHQ